MLLRRMKCAIGKLLTADRPPVAPAVPLLPELIPLMPCGWQLRTVADVPGALTILGQNEIPVVLCDRDLPNVRWKEAVRILAAAPSKPSVVLLSPSISPELWEQITESGGYDVLRRPVAPEDLQRALRGGLWRWRSSRRLQMMRGIPLHS